MGGRSAEILNGGADAIVRTIALGAVLGHVFPVWLKFKGGKGVATYLGVCLALSWPVGLLVAALLARWVPILPFRVARYYVEVTLSIALGLWDRWRQGPPAAWEKAEGTR